MGTRSDIIVQRRDGKFARVYAHWDGYISHNGQILFNHYNSQERAEELVKEGDISSLGEHCDKAEGHSYDTAVKGHTVYYGRDRGEDDVAAKITDTLEDGHRNEYTYLWRDGAWYVASGSGGKYELLADAIRSDEAAEE